MDTSNGNGKPTRLPWMDSADLAAKEMFKKLLEERRRSGVPLAVLRDGKVVLVPAEEFKLDETTNGQPVNGTLHGQ